MILDEVDSTNAEARRRAPVAAPVWIAARRQTGARGRQGRPWSSPEGNLAATLLLPRCDPPADLARFSFHAALAVAEMLAAFAPAARVTLKWPNDALLDGGKVAGILLEHFGRGQLAIGIGVNLAHHPPPAETRWPPASLAAVAGRAPAPEAALTVLAGRLQHWLAMHDARGFAPVRAAWLARAHRLGGTIEARLPDRTLRGKFEDVDSTGALVLRTSGRRHVIAAADIFLPDQRFPEP